MTSETYPSNWNKIFSFKNLFILGLIIVIIYLVKCTGNKASNENQPQVKGDTIAKAVIYVDREKKNNDDSFAIVLAATEKEKNGYYKKWQDEIVLHTRAERAIDDLLNEDVPDTCRAIQQRYAADFKKLSVSSQQKDNAAANTIISLQRQNKTPKDFLASKDLSFAKLKSISDTCAKTVKEWEDYAKKNKLKGELYVGAFAISEYDKINPSLGLSLGYRTKNGVQVEVGGTLNKQVFLSLKRKLF